MKKNLLLLISLLYFSLSKAQTGSAINFDGVNDYCSRAPLAASQPSNLTLEVRANFTGTSSVNQYMAFNGLNTGTAACGYGLLIFSGQSSLTIHYGGLGVVSTAIPLNAGTWNMYSLVFGSSNTFTMYVNGVNTFTFNSGVNPIAPSTGSFVIGANALGSETFNGSIDDVRLWNRALCASEVSLRANCQLLGNELGLVANYKFNQGTAASANSTVTTLIDGSPNAFNCILNNFALTGGASNWINPVGTLSTSCTSPAPLTASISPSSNPTICVGAATTLSVSGGINTFTWSTSSTSVSISVSPSVTTTYSVIGTNTTTGCSGMAARTIVVDPTPTISVNSGSICAGNSFTILPSGASTYTYSGGLSVVSPTATNAYTVTGTSASGCLGSPAVSNVTVNALPTISAASSNSAYICAGQTATLTATGGNTYVWNTTATTAVIAISPTTTTSYTITGTGANGCSANAVISQSVSTCTGINSNFSNLSSNFIVYPNPSNGIFNLQLETSTPLSLTIIEVTDVLGRVILTDNVNTGDYELNLGNNVNGIYFIKATVDGKTKTVKIVKE